MSLDDILEIIIEVFEDNILNQLAFLVLRVKQVFDLYDIRTIFQHVKHLVLSAHSFGNSLYPLEGYSLTCLPIDRLKYIT